MADRCKSRLPCSLGRFRQTVWLVACLALCGVAGCGDSRAEPVPASGRVLIDGKPLTAGFVRVYTDDGRSASAKIQSDGSFALTTYQEGDGCIPGDHAVSVVAIKPLAETGQVHHRRVDPQSMIPLRYRDPHTSGLRIEIDQPRDDLILKLESR